MDKLRKALSGEDRSSPDEETGIMDQISETLTLRTGTRIKGFIILFLAGILCSMLGSLCLFFGLRLSAFAVFYTLGNILSIGSTCYLMGPVNQLKKMFSFTRMTATIMVIVLICLTMYAAFVIKKPPLVLLFIILESLAMTWYSLSYIPYARDFVKKAVLTCFG